MKTLSRNRKRMPRFYAPLLLEYAFEVPLSRSGSSSSGNPGRSFDHSGVTTPAVNIIETPDDYRLEMVAPGMKKENFRIELFENVLSITYDHADNRESHTRGWKYLQHEYNYHSFSRSFSLPESVEAAGIEARYADGILNLLIPKKEQARSKPAQVIHVD